MLASIVASIQIQCPNNVSVQVRLLSESIAKQSFDPHIQPLSSLTTEKSSTSDTSHHFATVNIPIKKKPRQTKIWVGATDIKSIAEMDVYISDLIHINILPF